MLHFVATFLAEVGELVWTSVAVPGPVPSQSQTTTPSDWPQLTSPPWPGPVGVAGEESLRVVPPPETRLGEVVTAHPQQHDAV